VVAQIERRAGGASQHKAAPTPVAGQLFLSHLRALNVGSN
jgi:hypothetical protein